MYLILLRLVYIFIIFSFSLSNSSIYLKKNITSLLGTTDSYYYNNDILVSTEGGVYSINAESYNVYNNNLNIYNVSSIAEDQWNRIWLTSNDNGTIQILDSSYNLIDFIDYPDFDNIIKVVFTSSHAYAIVLNDQEYFIVQYAYTNSSINYLNIIDDFNLSFSKINDIAVYDSNIYVATDYGLLSTNFIINEHALFSSSVWNSSYVGQNILSLSENFFIDNNNDLYNIISNDSVNIASSESLINIYKKDNDGLFLLFDSSLCIYNTSLSNNIKL